MAERLQTVYDARSTAFLTEIIVTQHSFGTVEALKNLKNGKFFVCLEAAESPGRVKVINPNGDVLVVMEELFDLEPIEVVQADHASVFTPAQLESLQKYLDQQAELAEWRRLNPEPVRRVVLDDDRESSPSGGERKRPRKAAPVNIKGRVVAQWTADKLIFYRHHIEPLKPHESFVIRVENEGEYQMTKMEFQRYFNNVIMSSAYRTHGIFKYDQIPIEAQQFVKKRIQSV